ncbi:4Fe-4S dicluster domain-containing protein [Desulfobacula sp.]|uniref:4Fe-4S dicluster domain-containing protein n=1 Tax=Desulfobacula sp. TaxID=2593537 RepID=UPI00261188F0|nr:4Fe-4S dicluster domain-containing protein [Desulfobacula sp.]
MAHHTNKSGYSRLVDRINRFPQGAPPSRLLDKILALLFSETEAHLVSLLPIKPVTADKVAKIWKMTLPKAKKILDRLASRAILVDIDQNGESQYVLPPPMAGFFEFAMMRVRHDIDQKVLSELFYQYLNVEEDFIKHLFTLGDTQLGRVFVHEPVLSNENALHVLDYERASQVIQTATHMGISTCYCRHKMLHLHQACDRPLEICMTFNTAAASLIKHGHAKPVEAAQGLDLLDQAYESGLVQFGENVRERVNFICNCCGCCCEAMIAARRFALFNPVHPSNFIPETNRDTCTGCGNCVTACPVEAMTLVSANDPKTPKKKKARVNTDTCLGCGLCARSCKEGSITLTSLPRRVITPLNGTHRAVVMAIERGTLQHLIFDNKVLFSHRALAAVLGVILKLSPVKRLLASQQVKSRYLEALISRMEYSDMI